MPFNFKPISELGAIPVGETCDVLGIVSVREEAGSVATRFGQRTKRQVWAVSGCICCAERGDLGG